MHVFVRDGRGVGGELADDLLEDVFERHEPLDVAVFVDDERQAPAVALELVELHGERRAFGHEVGFARAGDLDQPLARQRVARQLLRHALHVQDADQVVELALVHRQARVRRLAQLVEDVFPVVVDVDRGDVLARDHCPRTSRCRDCRTSRSSVRRVRVHLPLDEAVAASSQISTTSGIVPGQRSRSPASSSEGAVADHGEHLGLGLGQFDPEGARKREPMVDKPFEIRQVFRS